MLVEMDEAFANLKTLRSKRHRAPIIAVRDARMTNGRAVPLLSLSIFYRRTHTLRSPGTVHAEARRRGDRDCGGAFLHSASPRLRVRRVSGECKCDQIAAFQCSIPRVQKPPTCHPEREGGGPGGREGSPQKSRCRSTGSAGRGRDTRYRVPPAQIRTRGITASGSYLE